MKTITEYINEAQQNRKEFMIIKPEFLDKRNDILKFLKEHNIIPIEELRKTLTIKEAHALYKIHSKEDFYDNLCSYMSSGDSIGFILCNYGDSDLLKLKDDIRTLWGKDEMRNVIHSSDSGINRARESKIYFATSKL